MIIKRLSLLSGLFLVIFLTACGGGGSAGELPDEEPVVEPEPLALEDVAGYWTYEYPGDGEDPAGEYAEVAFYGVIAPDGFVAIQVITVASITGAAVQESYSGYIQLVDEKISGRLNRVAKCFCSDEPELGFAVVEGVVVDETNMSLLVANSWGEFSYTLARDAAYAPAGDDFSQYVGMWSSDAFLGGSEFSLTFGSDGASIIGSFEGVCAVDAKLSTIDLRSTSFKKIDFSILGCDQAGEYVGTAQTGITRQQLSITIGNQEQTLQLTGRPPIF